MTAATIDETPAVTTASTQFEIHRNDWFEILDDVLPFAGVDDYLPMLTVVQVKVSADGLIEAATTDRITIGRHRFGLQGHAGDAVEILIPLAEVRALRRIHAPARRGTPNDLSITISSKSRAEVGAKPGTATGNGGGSITVASREGNVVSTHPGMDSTFVDVSQFLPDEMKSSPIDRIGWDPEYMARFAKVRGGNAMNTVIRFESASRPIRIDIAERFSGAIMPARQA